MAPIEIASSPPSCPGERDYSDETRRENEGARPDERAGHRVVLADHAVRGEARIVGAFGTPEQGQPRPGERVDGTRSGAGVVATVTLHGPL